MTESNVTARTGEVCSHPSGAEIFCPNHPWNSIRIDFKSIMGTCSECNRATTEWHVRE